MDSKTWKVSGYEFCAWASGLNRVGKKVYIWGLLALVDPPEYASGDAEFCVVSPKGERGKWTKMQPKRPNESGDPNLGNKMIASEKGIYQ